MSTPALLDPDKEHTLILVKPDGYARRLTGEILRRIEAKGYVIAGLKVMWASKELLEQHYAEHKDRDFFPGLLEFMSSGPVVAIAVQGNRVVEGMRILMGTTNPTLAAPGTIRGDLGRDWGSAHMENIVHGSDSPASAAREIALWFPELTGE